MSVILRIEFEWCPVVDGYGYQDVSGVLLAPDGSVLGSHVSSSIGFLLDDLTRNFGRDAVLAAAYPDGFSVEVVDTYRPMHWYDPAEVRPLAAPIEVEIAYLRREVGRLQNRCDRQDAAIRALRGAT